MSPQQIDQINRNEHDLDSDVGYSLAVIILYCCTFTNPIDSIYQINQSNKITINQRALTEQIELVKQKFSHQFMGNLLEKMLHQDKKSRIDIQMVNSILIPYKQKIQNMQNFTQGLNEKEKGSYEIIHTKNSNKQESKQNSDLLHIFNPQQQKNTKNKGHFQFGRKQSQSNMNHKIEFKDISMVNSYQTDNYSQVMDKKYAHKYQNVFQNNVIQDQERQQSEFRRNNFQDQLDKMFKDNFTKDKVIYSQTYSNSNMMSQQYNEHN